MGEQLFELLIDSSGLAGGGAADGIRELLRGQTGVTIIEVDGELPMLPTPVCRATSREILEVVLQEVERRGGSASIVERSRNEIPSVLRSSFVRYAEGLNEVLHSIHVDEIETMGRDLIAARSNRNKIIFLGNGGSAAIASHAATDFAKQRFPEEKFQFRAISLTDNAPLITATGNDFGYDRIFEQQLRLVLDRGDVVVAISSSGNSPNVVRAVEYANAHGALTYGVSGFDGGTLREVAHKGVHIPTKVGQYGYHEDASMVLFHVLSIFVFEQDQKQREE